jgi:hypothetical protein
MMPRQLALETIQSIHTLLPLEDVSGKSYLEKKRFDKGCSEFDIVDYRRGDEYDITYYYWTDRWATLRRETEKPMPRNAFWGWLKDKSGAEYLALGTYIGLVLAAGALVVAIFALARDRGEELTVLLQPTPQ